MSRLDRQPCGFPLSYQATESVNKVDREAGRRRDLLLRFGLAAVVWLTIITTNLALNSAYVGRLPESSRDIS